MARFTGLIGIFLILGIAFLVSNNKKKINYLLVIRGLALQFGLAVLILKVEIVRKMFQAIGHGMENLELFAREGSKFVFGNVLPNPKVLGEFWGGSNAFIFAFNVPATIILVCVLVAILYHLGVMQRVVAVIAKGVHFIMGASGAEALSNVASAFVGQVEAQVMIRPYLIGMTKSELLASMAGSMACIAGGILVVYVNMGVPAEYLIAASLMAAPGALVISKIIYPETEESQTKGSVTVKITSPYSNLIDAISHGASDGMKISLNVIAMLIGFIALIAFINALLGLIHPMLSLNLIFGYAFYPFAWAMGVPASDVADIAAMMGQKLSINEFVAYSNLTSYIRSISGLKSLLQNKELLKEVYPIAQTLLKQGKLPYSEALTIYNTGLISKEQLLLFVKYKGLILDFNNHQVLLRGLSEKAIMIGSFALCGFANFSSVGIQIGGIGEIAPTRRADLAQLGLRALLAGTLASYMSATIAGMLM